MPNDSSPEWEALLSCAARLQKIIPEAILVGGTAAALYANHRHSHDADHILSDLTQRFDQILAALESVSGWSTARVKRPVMILGSLDGIETGIRQLIRTQALETRELMVNGVKITVPTEQEILRIKAALILKRNATRDYLDFVALATHLGMTATLAALVNLDVLYPQPSSESAIQQLQIQLANPLPYDLDVGNLDNYRNLDVRWHDWKEVKKICIDLALGLLDVVTMKKPPGKSTPGSGG